MRWERWNFMSIYFWMIWFWEPRIKFLAPLTIKTTLYSSNKKSTRKILMISSFLYAIWRLSKISCIYWTKIFTENVWDIFYSEICELSRISWEKLIFLVYPGATISKVIKKHLRSLPLISKELILYKISYFVRWFRRVPKWGFIVFSKLRSSPKSVEWILMRRIVRYW